ncbi:MAG TPA: hypothetical protein VFM45_05855, partial [Anaeromyxobacteraceae bacterium]|nr:hypothetical protein [Anaeromyxobacteraceae bacterium]
MNSARTLALLAAASLLASACGGSSDTPVPPPSPPSIASFAASPSSVAPGGSSTLSWSVTGATTLSIDGGVGVVTGTSRAVTPASTTTYTLTATNAGGSSTATATVTVSAVAPPVIASFAATPSSVAPGGSSTLSWSVTGATTLSIDNGVGTVTGTSRAVTPAATTTYTLTATNAGGSRTATATVTVGGTPSPLEVACSGIGCGASGPATYSGSGVGVWRRTNAGSASETVSFTLDGVTAGKSVVLLFSNGAESATTLPNGGVAGDPPLAAAALAMPPAPPVEGDPVQEAADRADLWMIARNRVEAAIARDLAASPAASLAAPAAPLPTPAVGDTRTWWDNYPTTPVQYTAVAKRVCALPGGRNGILWVDPNATAAGNVTEADLDYFQATFCGTSGGYARIVALRGEPWGTTDVVALNPDVFIQDTPAPQDVHVVFLNVPSSTTWGGYFYGFNNVLRTYDSRHATSNEALAFFINAPGVRINRGYYASTLLHEATHMVNYYQRSIVKGATYDT